MYQYVSSYKYIQAWKERNGEIKKYSEGVDY